MTHRCLSILRKMNHQKMNHLKMNHLTMNTTPKWTVMGEMKSCLTNFWT